MKRLFLLLSLPLFFLLKSVVPAIAGEADCSLYDGTTILDGECIVDGEEGICCIDGGLEVY